MSKLICFLKSLGHPPTQRISAVKFCIMRWKFTIAKGDESHFHKKRSYLQHLPVFYFCFSLSPGTLLLLHLITIIWALSNHDSIRIRGFVFCSIYSSGISFGANSHTAIIITNPLRADWLGLEAAAVHRDRPKNNDRDIPLHMNDRAAGTRSSDDGLHFLAYLMCMCCPLNPSILIFDWNGIVSE